MKRSSIWKLIGLAGLAGVAASGVAVARAERQRRSYTPDEVRSRLHERLASAGGGPQPGDRSPAGPAGGPTRRRPGRWRRRRSEGG